MILYHYTCEHAADKIRKSGVLEPHPHPHLPQIAPMVWLSNLPIVGVPMDVEKLALGITDRTCDRYAWRVTVAVRLGVFHWPRWSRRNCVMAQRHAIELNNKGLLPAHWWLAFRRLPVLAVQPVGEPLVWAAGDGAPQLADLDLTVFFEDTPGVKEETRADPREPVRRRRPRRGRKARGRIHDLPG